MTAAFVEKLSGPLLEVRSRPLFTMKLAVRPMEVIGATPGGMRRVGIVTGGEFEGERLSGRIVEGGSDWQTLRADGSVRLDVRLELETSEGDKILMTYAGVRHGSPDILARIDSGEEVDPASYYFRINPLFETASATVGWLNGVVAIGIGHRFSDGPVYNVFELL